MESGTKLAHYEILSAIGKGGMGEVWKAKDTKLGREVAIKTLPEEFAKEAVRVARFRREAQLLASLNHPNIAAIHGFEEDNGTHFLVLELVEGDTLADRVKRGAIQVEESLKLALQIAEALEAAHEKGVIHRDLKPANVKVTDEGKVKVLDFGLAKAFAGDGSEVDISNSPTLRMQATQQGIILGTAAYMSPEQASGEATDKRADIWSFGVVLFEMLTGRQMFTGKNTTHILANVIRAEPEWNSLPANLHPRLRLLIERCLEKEPKDRCHDIADARVDIQKVLADPNGVFVQPVAEIIQARPQSKLPWVAAVVLGMIAAGLAVWYVRTPEPPPVTRFAFVLLEDNFRNTARPVVGLSPDGSQLVYNAVGGLYLRSMDELGSRVIAGTEAPLTNPVFSPDGEWLTYSQPGQLLKIAAVGGAPVPLTDVGSNPLGISWDVEETILYGAPEGVMQVSSDGGEPELLVPRLEEGAIGYPQLLPGGSAVLFDTAGGQVGVQSLESEERKILFPGQRPRYVLTGHLIYGLNGVLFAAPFDLDTLAVTGGPVPLVEGVRIPPTQYAVSDSGSLVYVPGVTDVAEDRVLGLVDRNGNVELLNARPNAYRSPRLSPQGDRVVVETDGEDGSHIWVYDVSGTTAIRQFTQVGNNIGPIWTPDGERITFASDRDGPMSIYWQNADGSGVAERITVPDEGIAHRPEAWSPDGRTLSFTAYGSENAARPLGVAPYTMSIWTLSLEGDDEAALFFDQPDSDEWGSEFSPDGRWLLYSSGRGTIRDVFVRPFPDTGAVYQITQDGGTASGWSRDGTEIYYRSSGSRLSDRSSFRMVDVRTEPGFSFGIERDLPISGYETVIVSRDYDITPDGERFIMMLPAEQTESGEPIRPQINIVLNWFEELTERVPVP